MNEDKEQDEEQTTIIWMDARETHEETLASKEDRDVPMIVRMTTPDLFDNGFTSGRPSCHTIINQQRAMTHTTKHAESEWRKRWTRRTKVSRER